MSATIDLTKPIKIVQAIYAAHFRRQYFVPPADGDWGHVGAPRAFCDTGFLPEHVARRRSDLLHVMDAGAVPTKEAWEENFREIDAYRRLFEAAPEMLELLIEELRAYVKPRDGEKAKPYDAMKHMQRVHAVVESIAPELFVSEPPNPEWDAFNARVRADQEASRREGAERTRQYERRLLFGEEIEGEIEG